MSKEKNYCQDFIKGIACICVVFMHCEFPGQCGIIVQAVSRFCVPFFFMISGFYCYNNDAERIRGKIVHILKLIAWTSAFYFLFALIQYNYLGNAPDIFKVSLLDLGCFVFFNAPVVIAGQLWFLFALLYDYVLFYLIKKLKLINAAHVMIPVLVLCYIFCAQGAVLIGIHIPKLIYRNFLIEGFTFFMLGHLLHQYEGRATKLNDALLWALAGVTTALCVVERYLLGRDFGVNISTFPQVTCVFILGMKHAGKFEKSVIRKLGTRCSMFVYVLHPFVITCVTLLYQRLGIAANTAALYIMPLIVLGISIGLALLLTIRKNRKAKEDG